MNLPVPVRCIHRPRVSGRVVPWTTVQSPPRTLLGIPGTEHGVTAAFGALDLARQATAVIGRLCQVCGDPLEGLNVYLLRSADIANGHTVEPALHPECYAYSRLACPTFNGGSDHYRRSPLNLRPVQDEAGGCPWPLPPTNPDRAGHGHETWDAWYVPPEQYRVHHSDDGKVGLSLDDVAAVRTTRVRTAALPPQAQPFLDAIASLFGPVKPHTSATPGHDNDS